MSTRQTQRMLSANHVSRIQTASCSIDGVAVILQDLVQSRDPKISRMAYACSDLLERISEELDEVAASIENLEPACPMAHASGAA